MPDHLIDFPDSPPKKKGTRPVEVASVIKPDRAPDIRNSADRFPLDRLTDDGAPGSIDTEP